MESGDESEEEEVRITREGEETINARLSPNTKYKYTKFVEKWVQVMRNPDLWIEEGNGGGHIDLDNVSKEQLKHFFAYIKTKRNRDGTAKISEDGTRTPMSYQHVSGFKSAIKDYYKTKLISDKSLDRKWDLWRRI